MKESTNLQDGFLSQLRTEKIDVAIYLTSGIKLTGKIVGFDRFAILLDSSKPAQLVFKHGIATVSPQQGKFKYRTQSAAAAAAT